MKLLLTGRNGQVGSELEKVLQPAVATDRAALDLADAAAIRRLVREHQPDVLINAGAYTAVDKAEDEPDLAMAVNGQAPGVLAEEARRLGALMVHYSTDYIFDGTKRSPYVEDDAPNPLGVYGRTKLEGEARIRASGCRHLIVRTAWVYGRGGNFVRAILRQAERGAALRVVDDQIAAPRARGAGTRSRSRSCGLPGGVPRCAPSAPRSTAPGRRGRATRCSTTASCADRASRRSGNGARGSRRI